MNTRLHTKTRQRLFSLWLVSAGLCALQPVPAVAAQVAPQTVEIVAFEVEPMQQFAAGSTLVFRVRGTPGGRATVRISGLAQTLALHQTAAGLYEGSHVVGRRDRIDGRAAATATLRLGVHSATARLARLTDGPASATRRLPSAPPGTQASVPVPSAPTSYVVSRFSIAPVDQVGPGAMLQFEVEGTPGGLATVTIDGVATRIALSEGDPGFYKGSYTVQPQDQVLIGFRAVASLQEPPERAAAARALGLVSGASAPAVHNVLPKEGSTVPTGAVSIAGHFGDPSASGVDPKSVRLLVGGRDVTRDASITSSTFNYRAELRPGTYPVEVSGRDPAGQAIRYAWQFTVGSGSGSGGGRVPTAAAASAGGLPLEVTSHLPNATVQPGRIAVSVRTAPGAAVKVLVNAVAPGAAAPPETLFSNVLRADAGGDLAFAFQPRSAVHGTRYEIDLEASDRGQSKSSRVLLFQQR